MDAKQLIDAAMTDLKAGLATEGQECIDHLRDAAVNIDMALDLLAEDAQ